MTEQRPLLTFRLANQQYAFPVEQVLEVAAMVKLTSTPDSAPEVLGLANRHGEVLPIVDLRKVFKLATEPITISTLLIVVEAKAKRVGFVVDEIFQVKYIMKDTLKPTQGAGQYVTHIVGDGENLFQLIDANSLIKKYLS
jgi:purine-binding chemotaxis protein CheW